MSERPQVTRTTHVLPFERLSPLDFERLCLWLVRREGYERAEHLGAAGGEKGRDIVAWRDGRRVVFQCKRVDRLDPSGAEKEIEKLRSLPAEDQPDDVVFVVSTAVSVTTRDRARAAWGDEGSCDFWAGTELDERVKRHAEITQEFFYLGSEAPQGPSNFSGIMSIPDVPPHYLPRVSHQESVKRRLLKAVRSTAEIVRERRIGIHGMGGIGKTVLAAAVARDLEIGEAFSDGVFWLTVGKNPSVLRLQFELAVALGQTEIFFRTEYQGKMMLKQLLAKSSCLLILDDVWELKHVVMLDVVGRQGSLIVTTRDEEILVGLGASEHRIEVLRAEQAIMLLASWSGRKVREMPEISREVAKLCGYLPLALAMIGAMVRLRPTAWEDVLYRLEHADLDKIRQKLPDYPYPDLLRAIEVSVEALSRKERQLYTELAVFPDAASVPEAPIELLWSTRGLSPIASREVLNRLVTRALLERTSDGRVRLHDLLRRYVRKRTSDLQVLHNLLIDAYSTLCPEGFARAENDGYVYDRLPYHLARADRLDEVREILTDCRWLQTKLRLAGPQAAIEDYNELPEKDDIRRIGETLRLAANVLIRYPDQLGGQFLGRLQDRTSEAGVKRVLDESKLGMTSSWLRPLHRSLEAPGGSLLRILGGHLAGVTSVCVLKTGRIVSGSLDSLATVWDPKAGSCIRFLAGHSKSVTGLATIQLDTVERLVSSSSDGTIILWDLETGETVATLKGHTDAVTCVAALPDKLLASGSSDGDIRIWRPEGGQCLEKLTAHPKGVGRIIPLPGKTGALLASSAFWERSVKIWDLDRGHCIQEIKPELSVRGLALLQDGKIATAGGALQIWDIDTGRRLETATDPWRSMSSVEALPDGRIISGTNMGFIQVWDRYLKESTHDLAGHAGGVTSLAALSENTFVSGSSDRTVRLWSTRPGTTSKNLESHVAGVRDLAVLADGRAISGSSDWTLRLWSPQSGRCTQTYVGHTDEVHSVAVMPNGRIVSSTLRDMRSWNVNLSLPLRTVDLIGTFALTPLPDGRTVAGCADGSLQIWDMEMGRLVRRIEACKSSVWDLAALADGRFISVSQNGNIRTWDSQNGECISMLSNESEGRWRIDVLPDGRLVCGTLDGKLRIWNVEDQRCLKSQERTGPIISLAALDNKTVITGSENSVITAWCVDTLRVLSSFCTDAAVMSIAAGREPSTVVAGDRSGRVHFLRLER